MKSGIRCTSYELYKDSKNRRKQRTVSYSYHTTKVFTYGYVLICNPKMKYYTFDMLMKGIQTLVRPKTSLFLVFLQFFGYKKIKLSLKG